MLKLIVAVDENWAIGKDNELLFHIKEDLIRFKSLTLGQNVVMDAKPWSLCPKVRRYLNALTLCSQEVN